MVLLDFGLTADLESVGAERQIVGTVGHMSPEQAAGKAVSTPATGTAWASCSMKR